MAEANSTREQLRFLVVEGVSEEHLFNALFAHMRRGGVEVGDIEIIVSEGKDNIRGDIQAITQITNFDAVVSIGVVRDADDNAADAFRSVQGALRAAGLPAPSAPLSVVGSDPKVAALILHHGRSSGVLEDVCLEAMEDDPAMGCVRDYISCIKGRLDARAQPRSPSKAMAQAFLASRRESGLLLGQAAHRGYWDFEHSAFDALKEFVGMLQ